MRSIRSFFSAGQVEHFNVRLDFQSEKNKRNGVNKIQPVTQTRRVLKSKEQAPMPVNKRKVPPLLIKEDAAQGLWPVRFPEQQ
ncbi:hypothetical protein TNIN_279411 [Trichonephila inaurata madagascariensis]|uniref:Uncharacterized protein n=1 Tax=Trichonephila inaurata madagascariensis TaxID=2747483 RepID=A0A8X6XUM2_9ARAC|nr:hypothetical protein TNIN_279411 [Trichonephila inaurata madagascariensis]